MIDFQTKFQIPSSSASSVIPIKSNDKLRFYKDVFLYQISGLLQPFTPQKFRDIMIMLIVRLRTITVAARLSTGHRFVQSFIKICQLVLKLLRVDRCTDMIYHCLRYKTEESTIKLLNLKKYVFYREITVLRLRMSEATPVLLPVVFTACTRTPLLLHRNWEISRQKSRSVQGFSNVTAHSQCTTVVTFTFKKQ